MSSNRKEGAYDPWRCAACGVVAGALSAASTFPLDTIKSRIQVFGKPEGMSWIAMTRSAIRNDGMLSLYRGVGTNLVALAPSMGIFFFSYESLKQLTGDSVVLAASGSWIAVVSATNPLWMLKLRRQTRVVDGGSMSIVHSLRAIAKSEGIWRGLFGKGMLSGYLGAVGVSIQMVLYEGTKETVPIPLASGMSMAISNAIVYPHEVVRSRLQAGVSSSIFQTLRDVWRSAAGLRGFYTGFPLNLCRLVLGSVITFTTYEACLTALHPRPRAEQS